MNTATSSENSLHMEQEHPKSPACHWAKPGRMQDATN